MWILGECDKSQCGGHGVDLPVLGAQTKISISPQDLPYPAKSSALVVLMSFPLPLLVAVS